MNGSGQANFKTSGRSVSCTVALAYVHQLLLGVVLSAAALPVAVGLIHSLELLLAVVSIRLVLQVQRAAVAALWRIHRDGASLFTDKITEYFYTPKHTTAELPVS